MVNFLCTLTSLKIFISIFSFLDSGSALKVYFIIVNLNFFSVNLLYSLPVNVLLGVSIISHWILYFSYPDLSLFNRTKSFFYITKNKKQMCSAFSFVSWIHFRGGFSSESLPFYFSFSIFHNAFLYTSWHFLLTPVRTWFCNICSCHEEGWCILFSSLSPGSYCKRRKWFMPGVGGK